jgi:exodeoxyribonuclease VII small subunit
MRLTSGFGDLYRGRLANGTRAMAATEKSNDLGGLEKSLEELEALVVRLESGDLPLEQALKEFEHGVKLTRQCQAALQEAEQKVEILLKKTASAEPIPFTNADEE